MYNREKRISELLDKELNFVGTLIEVENNLFYIFEDEGISTRSMFEYDFERDLRYEDSYYCAYGYLDSEDTGVNIRYQILDVSSFDSKKEELAWDELNELRSNIQVQFSGYNFY